MTWVAVGVGTATVASGALSADAASRASAAQAGAAGAATRPQVSQDALNRADNAQYLGTGSAANKRLAQLLGLKSKAPTMEDAAAQVLNDHKARLGVGYVPGETNMDTVHAEEQRVFDNMQKQYQADNATSSPEDGSLLRKFTTQDLNADPVYTSGLKFGLDRGTEGINARATASGMYDSGATLKALTQFGNDYGSTKANESFNRFNATNDSIFNKLSGVSGTGQVATGQVQSSGTNMANNVGNSVESAGNARAAGIVGGANAWNSAVTGVSGTANSYQNNEILKKLLARNNPSVASYDPSMYAG